MENNIENNRIFKNEQYSFFNPYNHVYYTCIKFHDFILDQKDYTNQTKGNLVNLTNFQRILPRSTCFLSIRIPYRTRLITLPAIPPLLILTLKITYQKCDYRSIRKVLAL